MDDSIYIPTLVVSVIFLAVYIFQCRRNGKAFDVSVLVSAVLGASGVSGGGFLMLSTVIPSLKEKLSNLNLYIFIAGLVVLVVSFQSLYREVTKK
jgi:hypothetical protein